MPVIPESLGRLGDETKRGVPTSPAAGYIPRFESVQQGFESVQQFGEEVGASMVRNTQAIGHHLSGFFEYLLHKGLLQFFLRPDEDPEEKARKILILPPLVCAFLCVTMWQLFLTIDRFWHTGPVRLFLGALAVLCLGLPTVYALVTKRLPRSQIIYSGAGLTITVLLVDVTNVGLYDNWLLVILLMDMMQIIEAERKIMITCVVATVLWIAVKTAEEAIMFGLYDLMPYSGFKQNVRYARGPAWGSTVFAIRVGVFLGNYMTTRRFATRARNTLVAAQDIAQALSLYDLEAASAVLQESELPIEFSQAYSKLISNLTSYKAFLPQSLFSAQAEQIAGVSYGGGAGAAQAVMALQQSSRAPPQTIDNAELIQRQIVEQRERAARRALRVENEKLQAAPPPPQGVAADRAASLRLWRQQAMALASELKKWGRIVPTAGGEVISAAAGLRKALAEAMDTAERVLPKVVTGHSRFSDGISPSVGLRVRPPKFFAALRDKELPSITAAVTEALRAGGGDFWLCGVCGEGSNSTPEAHAMACHTYNEPAIKRPMSPEWLLKQVPLGCGSPAVSLYCQHSPLCYEGNLLMRSGALTGRPPEGRLSSYLPYELLLHLDLLQLEIFTGYTYRAVTFIANTIWDYRPGNLVLWNQPSSSSADAKAIRWFLDSGDDDGGPVGTIFVIRSRNGRIIWHLSRYPEEEEVLFPTGTLFRVAPAVTDGVRELLSRALRCPLNNVCIVELFELPLLFWGDAVAALNAEERARNPRLLRMLDQIAEAGGHDEVLDELHQRTVIGPSMAAMPADRCHELGGGTLVHLAACEAGNLPTLQVVTYALSAEAVDMGDYDNFSPLFHAVRAGYASHAVHLLTCGASSAGAGVHAHRLPRMACEWSSEELLTILDASPPVVGGATRTWQWGGECAIAASRAGNLAALRWLPVAARKHRDSDGRDALWHAARAGHAVCVRELCRVQRESKVQRAQPRMGAGALSTTLAQRVGKGARAWKQLAGATYRVPINQGDVLGLTPAHAAAMSGDGASVDAIADAGADLCAVAEDGTAPMHLAAAAGSHGAVEVLLRRGGDPAARRLTSRGPAADAARLQPRRLSVLDGGLGAIRGDGYTRGMPSAGTFRLPSGMMVGSRRPSSRDGAAPPPPSSTAPLPPHVQKREGWTPLHDAAAGGHASVVELLKAELVALGIEVMVAAGGWTPLHCAALHGHTGCVVLLMRKGADPHARDDTGCTPLRIAAAGGHLAAAAVLAAAGPACLATGDAEIRVQIEEAAAVAAAGMGTGKLEGAGIEESGHTIVFGWTERTIPLLRQLDAGLTMGGGGCIVIVAKGMTQAKMEQELASENVPPAGSSTRVVCRSGDASMLHTALLLSVDQAASVIILSSREGDNALAYADADNFALRVVQSLKAAGFGKGEGSAHAIAMVEIADPQSKVRIKKAGGAMVETIAVHGLTGGGGPGGGGGGRARPWRERRAMRETAAMRSLPARESTPREVAAAAPWEHGGGVNLHGGGGGGAPAAASSPELRVSSTPRSIPGTDGLERMGSTLDLPAAQDGGIPNFGGQRLSLQRLLPQDAAPSTSTRAPSDVDVDTAQMLNVPAPAPGKPAGGFFKSGGDGRGGPSSADNPLHAARRRDEQDDSRPDLLKGNQRART